MTYTIQQFAEMQKISERWVQQLIAQDKLPQGYYLFEKTKKERYIIKKKVEDVKYKHANDLSAEEILAINKCLDDEKFYRKNSGDVNVKKVAEKTEQHYWTIYRFLKKSYKRKEANRADKGKSRVLTEKEIETARNSFEVLFLQNAQGNVQLTIEKVEWNNGIKIPQRLAYKWAREFKALHEQHHYYPKFMNNKTAHTIRDLWAEYENILDCVVADEWKIDEFGVWIPNSRKDYDDVVATAYIVMFQDMKTRYPLSILVTPHSTTSADTKRAAMELVKKYGKPKQWIFENAKTWKNQDFLSFIMGLYSDNEDMQGFSNIEFMDLEQLKTVEKETDYIVRSGVRHPQSKPIERTWRIFKDEYCAYLYSYSPNADESRKPTMRDSHPGVTRTFDELRSTFTHYLEHEFLLRKRAMFQNRMLSTAHEINKNRPKTIIEAFDRAYQKFTPDFVKPLKLAYLYADKYTAKFTKGQLEFVNRLSLEKMHFIPDDGEIAYRYFGERLTVLIDQYNQYHGWIFIADGKEAKYLCEANELRAIAPQSREQSNIVGKQKRKLTKAFKEHKKALAEYQEANNIRVFQYEKVMGDPVETAPIDENYGSDFDDDIATNIAQSESNENDFDWFDDDSQIDFS